MSSTDVRVLFPDREKKKRTRRGQRPTRWLNAPSYDDMIKVAFNPTISDIQKYGRSKVTFYFLQKEENNKNLFGYMKIVEDSLYPNTIDTYAMLQAVYNDILNTPDWHDKVEDLIQQRSTKPSARLKNVEFMNKVRAQFNLPAPTPVVADTIEAPVVADPLAAQPMDGNPRRPQRLPRPPRMIQQVPVEELVAHPIVEDAPINQAVFPNAVVAINGREIINQADINRAREVFFDAEQVLVRRALERERERNDQGIVEDYNVYWADDEIRF